jgi:D-glycero-alpha-D-manno-heptose-7-phosphate kinase
MRSTPSRADIALLPSWPRRRAGSRPRTWASRSGARTRSPAALGGFNLIEFVKGSGVRTEPVITPRGTLEKLHLSLLLFFTGVQRSADDVLDDQRARMRAGETTEKLHAMRELAYEFRDALSAGEIDAVGELLHRNWELKRSLANSVTSELIDGAYAKARQAGASGGKLLGAGAGGFLLFFVPIDRQDAVRRALKGDLREVPFHFAGHGSQSCAWSASMPSEARAGLGTAR